MSDALLRHLLKRKIYRLRKQIDQINWTNISAADDAKKSMEMTNERITARTKDITQIEETIEETQEFLSTLLMESKTVKS